MQTFEVKLVALANVSTTITVEAGSKEEAEKKAIEYARDGNGEWEYDGVSDDKTIEVGE